MLDKFYTDPTIIPPLLENIDFGLYDCVVEPSAGNGSFSNILKYRHHNVHSYDILPDSSDISQADFLKDTLQVFSRYERILVIGNPPFGRQSNMAVKFFNRAARYSSVQSIAMIFPKSFRKASIQNRLSLDFLITAEMDIPEKSFLEDTVRVDVPCIFQVWNRTEQARSKHASSALVHNDMKFVKKEECTEDTLAIRRVGFYAGKCEPYNNHNEQSHLFLHTDRGSVVMDFLNGIEWKHNDTVGPRSISKQDFIHKLNKLPL